MQHSTATRLGLLVVALGTTATIGAAVADTPLGPQHPPRRQLAVTIDDLPYAAVDRKDSLADAHQATSALLRALEAHQAPAVVFVNESKLFVTGETDARAALLERWVRAGASIGNHTYSHLDFNKATVDEFEDDVLRGRTVSARLQPKPPGALFFRFPENHTGDTAAKKRAAADFLARRGYTIAPHTIDSSDFIFNAAYVRRLRAGDRATAERIRAAYVSFVMAATDFAESIAPGVFGRTIPQTLLIHASDLNAAALGDILAAYEARGYRFVALDDAMADAAYRTPDTLVTKFGPTWLWRWNASLERHVSFNADPEPPGWVVKLYEAGAN